MWNALEVVQQAVVVTSQVAAPAGAPTVARVDNWPVILVPAFFSLIQVFLLVYTFRENSRQKVVERQATWYHQIVVDPCIEHLEKFTTSSKDDLLATCCKLRELGQPKQNREEADQLIRKCLAKFQKDVLLVDLALTGPLSMFEGSPVRLFSARLDQLEADVSGWFEHDSRAEPWEHRSSLPVLLTNCQNELLRLLFSFEFEEWGWPAPKRR